MAVNYVILNFYKGRFVLTLHKYIYINIVFNIIISLLLQDTIKFDTGNLCMITGGRNTGRVGTIMSRYKNVNKMIAKLELSPVRCLM